MGKKKRKRAVDVKPRVVQWNLRDFRIEHEGAFLDGSAYLLSLPGEDQPQKIIRLEGEISVTPGDHGGFEDWTFDDVYRDIEEQIENTREVMLDEEGPEDLKYNWTEEQKANFQAQIDSAGELRMKVVELEKVLKEWVQNSDFLPPED